MTKPSSFSDAIGIITETYQLTLDSQDPSKLVIVQQLKVWTYLFLAIWSTLFAGIPLYVVGLFVTDCAKSGCQRVQLLGLLFIMLPFVVAGAIVAYISLRKRTIVLDKSDGLYVWKSHTLLGDRTQTYALEEIAAITIEKSRRRHKRRSYYVYQLVIHLRDRTIYKLPGMRTRPPVSRVLLAIRSFKGSNQPPSVISGENNAL